MSITFDYFKNHFKNGVSPDLWIYERDTPETFAFTRRDNRRLVRSYQNEKHLTNRLTAILHQPCLVYRTMLHRETLLHNEHLVLCVPEREKYIKLSMYIQNGEHMYLKMVAIKQYDHDMVYEKEAHGYHEWGEIFRTFVCELPEFRLHVVTGNTQEKG